MPTQLSTGRHVFFPTSRCVTPKNEVLLANGVDYAKRDDGISSALENAGLPLAVNGSFSGSFGTAGSITGSYSYAFRYIDDEGIPGDLSELQTATAASHSTISYTSVPVSTDSRVAARQIFRSTAGQSKVLYLDATINDNTTTSTSSTKSDTQLQASAELRMLAPDGSENARRFGIPPAWMGHVLYHNNRTHWMGAVRYSEGNAVVTNGSATVTIIGGVVTAPMDGWKFIKLGDTAEYTIDSVDTSANTLTLSANYAGTTDKFALYAVYKGREQQRRVYPSYAGEPESVNHNDALDIDSDYNPDVAIVGGYSFNSFVYVATAGRTYRWNFHNDVLAGDFFPTEDRGLLNKRCFCYVENFVACMDREGIYLFNGGNANPVSNVISDFLREKVFWANSQWFHAAAHPSEETVKFFVCLDGSRFPKHAICFNYRSLRWWWEEYPWQIAAGCTVPIASRKELLYGGPQEMLLMGGKYADVPDQTKELSARYSVTAATLMSVTVSPDWLDEADVALGPVSIVTGKGKGQTRQILGASTSTGKLKIDRPWLIKPDTTSRVVIGAVGYQLATKVFEVMPESKDYSVEADVQPTDNDASIDFKCYYNHRRTAETSAATRVHDSVTWTKNRADIEHAIDRDQTKGEWDGLAKVKLIGGHDGRGPAEMRYVQVELEGFQGKDPIVIHGLDVQGVE